jgi:hypothetical protein
MPGHLLVSKGSYFVNATPIWSEVLCDMGSQWAWSAEQLAYVRSGDLPHELGHWFIPWSAPARNHNPDNVMYVAPSDADEPVYTWLPLFFRPDHQRYIRSTACPHAQ